MYLLSSASDRAGIDAVRSNVTRTGTATADEDWRRATSVQVWASSINDPGEDFCLVRLFDGATLFETYRIDGY